MSDSRPETPRPPDPEDVALTKELRQLAGEEMPEDQDAVLEPDEIEERRTPTLTELDRGEAAPDSADVEGEAATLDGLAGEGLREGETDDPDVATEEGLIYVPPIDPPYDEDHGSGLLSGEPELTARIRDALEADASTADLADRLVVGTRGSSVVVRGVVDDINDSDNIAAVIERVTGVKEVIDETELADG